MDSAMWNARYEQAELLWSAGPNQFVVDNVRDLPPGRALDVACGEGRNALWLAAQGWSVVGVDFSSVAVDRARAIAEHRALAVDFRVGDVTDTAMVGGTFELVLVAYLHLPADDMTTTLAHLVGRVADAGTALVVGHHVDNISRGYGGPQDRAVLHDPATIAAALAPLHIVTAGEVERVVATGDGERTAIDSLVVARRPA